LIEHNLDVIKTSDQNIDLGPEGGEEGGKLVAKGTPEQVAGTKGSHTGRFLAEIVKPPARKKRAARAKVPAAA
jgi:excinuclease ABC subunit A